MTIRVAFAVLLVATTGLIGLARGPQAGAQGGDQFLDGIGETALIARYLFDGNAEDASRNQQHATMRGNGATFVDKAASYRIAMNNFTADGGDNFTVFRSCTDPLGGDVDLDAFTAYLGAHPNLAPPPLDRIHRDA